MARIAIPSPRIVTPTPRSLVLPVGMKGRASIFYDPTDDKTTGTNPLSGSQAWTILFWVRKTVLNAWGSLILVGDAIAGQGISISASASGRNPYVQLYAVAGATGVLDYGDEKWHRIGARFAGGTGKIQLLEDGAQSAETANVTPAIAGASVVIGKHAAGAASGSLQSDVRIYTRRLSDAEVAADNRGEWVDSTGLVCWWTCENPGYGTVVHEEVGNTDDVMTGALYDSRVPFRRLRVVEDVAAAFKCRFANYISVADNAALMAGTGAFSFLGWVWAPEAIAITNERIIQCSGTGLANWAIRRVVGSLPHVVMLYCFDAAGVYDNTGGTPSAVLRPGGWNHLAASRGPAGLLLRINAGPPATGVNNARNVSGANATTHLGSVAGGGVFGGLLSDFGYYVGKELSWDEIEAHYYDGVWPAGLTARWRMREGVLVNVAEDAGAAGGPFTGTATAASWSTATRCHAREAA